MWQSIKHKWIEPLSLAAGIPVSERCWVLLYSGMQLDFTGRYSILALKPDKQIKSKNFTTLEKALSDDRPAFENAWFGYLGYGLKNTLEKLPRDKAGTLPMPALWMARFTLIAVFDHEQKTITLHAKTKTALAFFATLKPKKKPTQTPRVASLRSNMTKDQYLRHVKNVRDDIVKGELYQANLTRKFYGTLKTATAPFDIFCRLAENSPAPYSAFIKTNDFAVISSSPESFLSITPGGSIETRPIKGSIGRKANAAEDRKLLQSLATSEKNRAENLMIVDLMRNDLSKVCDAGSIEVDSLFDITSYATVHHMSSTVKGVKRLDKNTLDVVKACFPPGSMTGAPKIQAIRLCSKLEKVERGVYSGAIGWLGGDGSADLSVVIRTLVLKGKQFEFQVGGGIVADSKPQDEWKETLVKARGLAKTLGISPETLGKL
jgi:para-aminobenzoate synthetase component 1